MKKGLWIKKKCTICDKEFETPLYHRSRKTCSKDCRYKQVSITHKSVPNSGHIKIGNIPWNKGLTKNDDIRLQIISNKSSIQMKKEYENGSRNRFEITKNARIKLKELKINPLKDITFADRSRVSKENAERLKESGRLGFQNYHVQMKARKNCASHSHGGSYIENIMKNLLNELDIKYIEQFKVNHPTLSKYYFIDFIIPWQRIAIECDGEPWHLDVDKDKYRQSIIEYNGWKVLRFKGNDIINNLCEVKNEIITSLKP